MDISKYPSTIGLITTVQCLNHKLKKKSAEEEGQKSGLCILDLGFGVVVVRGNKLEALTHSLAAVDVEQTLGLGQQSVKVKGQSEEK